MKKLIIVLLVLVVLSSCSFDRPDLEPIQEDVFTIIETGSISVVIGGLPVRIVNYPLVIIEQESTGKTHQISSYYTDYFRRVFLSLSGMDVGDSAIMLYRLDQYGNYDYLSFVSEL